MTAHTTAKLKDALQGFHGSVRWNQPLSKYTSWRIGGCADCIVYPRNTDALAELVQSLKTLGSAWMVLSGGTNLLFSDSGFRGVIIRLGSAFTEFNLQGSTLIAGAANPLHRVVRFSLSHGYAGLEPLIGIPGTLGGGLWGNAGAHDVNCLDHVVQLEGITPDGIRFATSHFQSAYRDAPLPTGHVITKAHFSLLPSDVSVLIRQMRIFIEQRKKTQPIGQATAGCTFKNPPNSSAGMLIDRCGLKGFRIGDAVISTIHANFLVNDNHATSSDMLALMRYIQRIVLDRFSILLNPEVRVIDEFGNHVEVLP